MELYSCKKEQVDVHGWRRVERTMHYATHTFFLWTASLCTVLGLEGLEKASNLIYSLGL